MGNNQDKGPQPTSSLLQSVNVEEIQGKWHVVATTFPMWLKGDKKEPSFTYSNLRKENDVFAFDDTVEYLEGDKVQKISGVDTQLSPISFRWQGNGWLFFFKSNWEVIAKQDDWAVIIFQSTIFTPAGMDVISRSKNIDKEMLNKVLEYVRSEPKASIYEKDMVLL